MDRAETADQEADAASRWLTRDRQADLLRWAGDRIGIGEWRADSEAMGLINPDGRIVMVGVLNMFADGGAWVHIATDGRRNWATRDVLGAFFYVPFVEMGLCRLTGRVAVSNIAAQITNLRLGFTVEGRERAAFRGEDVVVMGMLAHECPWLSGD